MKKYWINKILFFCILSIFYGCANLGEISKDTILNIQSKGEIINLKNKQSIKFQELIDQILKTDIILIGEIHDNFRHHLAKIAILQASLNKNDSLALEMIDSKKQSKIDALSKQISKENLKDAIGWDKKWKYKNYKEIVELAFYEANLKGANLAKDEIELIFRGAMPLNGVLSTTDNVKSQIAELIEQNHKMSDKNLLSLFVSVQQYKDRRMADVLLRQKGKAFLVAGNYHIYKNVGVPLHLKDFKNKKSVLSIVITNQNDPSIDFGVADFVWVLK